MEPLRNTRVALILAVYASSWAGLALSLGAGGPFAPAALVASLLVGPFALERGPQANAPAAGR